MTKTAEQKKRNEAGVVGTKIYVCASVIALLALISAWEGPGRYSGMANGISILIALAFVGLLSIVLIIVYAIWRVSFGYYLPITIIPAIVATYVCLSLFTPKPSCGVEYQNNSNSEIWIEDTGVLIHGATKGTHGLRPGKLSSPWEIVWWKGDDRQRPADPSLIFKAKVNVPEELPANHNLVFVLDSSDKWSVSVQPTGFE